jgi:hypothetical protein
MPTSEGYYTTYDLSTVNREDLVDVITMISPVETPFFSSVGKGTAKATLHEWPTDELAAAAANTHVEGADASGWASADRDRLTNYCQIFTQPFAVTTTQEVVDTAGIKSEKAYQAAKKMKEHKRDIEYAVFNNTTAGAAGNATTARTFKGIKAFISAATPDHLIAPAGGANTVLAESDLQDGIEACWNEGGMVDTVLCSAKVKRRISGFTKVTGLAVTTSGTTEQEMRTVGAADKKLTRAIDVYETDFGLLRIIPDRYIPIDTGTGGSTDVYILEMQRWDMPFLIRTFIEDLAKLGDSFRSWVYSQLTLAGKAPKGNYCVETVLNSI